MSPSLPYLERCALETGYSVGSLEKVVRLGELAGDISRDPLLGVVLALKGGSALNLCFTIPTRLSVDLDYNYVGRAGRAEMLADRPRVEQAVEQLALRRGYRVQRSKDTFAGRKLYLAYASARGPRDRIEVDLNFMFRMPLAGTEAREMWQPGNLERPTPRVVSLDELCVGKLLALLDRAAPRDAWDTGILPAIAGEVLQSHLFRSRFIALSAILPHPLSLYRRERLQEKLTQLAVDEQLVPMLDSRQQAKAATLVENAWSVLAPLVALSADEAAYLDAVNEGAVLTNLLFTDDPTEARRLAEHPAIRWKIDNVQRHRSRLID